MTEGEWLRCTESMLMVDFLRGKMSDRKLRLVAVGCCREVLHLLPDPCVLEGIGVAERLADHSATAEEVTAAATAIEMRLYELQQDRDNALQDYYDDIGSSCGCLWGCCEDETDERGKEKNPDGAGDFGYRALEKTTAIELAGLVGEAVCQALESSSECLASIGTACELARRISRLHSVQCCHRVRDICGVLPFRTTSISRSWLTSNVVGLARAMYDGGAFDGFQFLADALEEAGCDDKAILSHCRGPGTHGRGCWLIDLLLDKE